MEARGKMIKMLKGMQAVTDIPITAKFRMGVKDNSPIADRFIPKLEEMVKRKHNNTMNIFF